MNKIVTALSFTGLAVTGALGLSLAMPANDAAAKTPSQFYETLKECNGARNATLGTGYRGIVGPCVHTTLYGGYVVDGYYYTLGR